MCAAMTAMAYTSKEVYAILDFSGVDRKISGWQAEQRQDEKEKSENEFMVIDYT